MDIKRYQSKISGPLLDRIDIILEIPREHIDTLLDHKSFPPLKEISKEGVMGADSASLRRKVIAARKIQQERFKGLPLQANAHMTARELQQMIPLSSECKDFLSQAANALHLSGRVVHRTIKLARTIADMNNEEQIIVKHLAEAIQYRSKTMFIDEA
jgi:magnesium chelatase family protein